MSKRVAVPLLDLKAQYATLRSEIQPVVDEVLESQWFIGGHMFPASKKKSRSTWERSMASV